MMRSVYLTGCTAFVFSALYICMSILNYPATDDYFFYHLLDVQDSPWNAMVHYYHTWSPRWTSQLLMYGLMEVFGEHAPAGYALLTGTAFVSTFYYLFRLVIPSGYPFILSLLVFTGSFLSNPDPGDSWMWLCAGVIGVWSVLSILWIILLLHPANQWPEIVKAPLLTVLAVYVGGSSETVAVFLILGLSFFLIRSRLNRTITLISLVSVSISFIIYFIGDGREIRQTALPGFSIQESMYRVMYSYARLLIVKIIPLIPFLLITFLTAQSLPVNNRYKLSFGKLMIVSLTGLFILSFPGIWILKELPADRSLFPCYFFLFSLVLFVGLKLPLIHHGIPKFWPVVLLVVSLPVFSYRGLQAFRVSRAVQDRTDFLRSVNNEPEFPLLLSLEPLPPRGWMPDAEVSEDPGNFRNVHTASGLGLRFAIRKGME
jgi:hypothetical protein